MIHMRFDDKATRCARRAKDVFAPFRDLWESFVGNLRKYYIPGPFITIHEQLVPVGGRCSFLQFLPTKPDRYGMKILWATHCENNYPIAAIPYLGKDGGKRQEHLAWGMTLPYNQRYYIQLATPLFKSVRNITCDSHFTDMVQADTLLKNEVTFVGKVRQNKKNILPENFKEKVSPTA